MFRLRDVPILRASRYDYGRGTVVPESETREVPGRVRGCLVRSPFYPRRRVVLSSGTIRTGQVWKVRRFDGVGGRSGDRFGSLSKETVLGEGLLISSETRVPYVLLTVSRPSPPLFVNVVEGERAPGSSNRPDGTPMSCV